MTNADKEIAWYYDTDTAEQELAYCDVNDPGVMYQNLAEQMAEQMYESVYGKIRAYVHKTENVFYGDYPTIWDQMKYDAEHGEFMHSDHLTEICQEYLREYKVQEVYLLWVYACEHSNCRSVYDREPEFLDCLADISNIVLSRLYSAAEAENRDW